MSEDTAINAIEATEKALAANKDLQERLNKYILDLENEQEQLDNLTVSCLSMHSNLSLMNHADQLVQSRIVPP
jgi:hypothetical protein